MVNALINLNEDTNRILNIVKARYGFKDKGEAIEFVINKYLEQEGEPEFIEKIKEIENQRSILVDDFTKRYS